MDTLDGLRVVYFSMQDIESFFRKNSEILTSKKGTEIWIGVLVAKSASDQSKRFCAGFPLKTFLGHSQEYRPTINEVFDHLSTIQDTDVDICMAEEGNLQKSLFRLQVTRFMGQSMIGLEALIKKKCAIQEDKALHLIIHIENDFSCDLEFLKDFVGSQNIPYGQITLIGKVSSVENKFFRLDIYPEIREHRTFHILES